MPEAVKPLNTFTWTPYRGEFEKVTNIILARLNVWANHIEVLIAYDYITLKDDVELVKGQQADKDDFKNVETRIHAIIPINQIQVTRTIAFTKANPDDTCHVIDIRSNNDSIWLWGKEKEIDKIMKELRNEVLFVGRK